MLVLFFIPKYKYPLYLIKINIKLVLYLNVVIKMKTSNEIKKEILGLGGKEWVNHGKERVI